MWVTFRNDPRRGLRTFVRDARRGHQAKRGRKKQMSCKKDSLPAMMVMTNIHKTGAFPLGAFPGT
ncbi:hypothetical protein D9545_04050 [Geobacillus stearothermophilus]|nr:hypothetical protein D9545_04050 [Geobacillus stearothermophilus]